MKSVHELRFKVVASFMCAIIGTGVVIYSIGLPAPTSPVWAAYMMLFFTPAFMLWDKTYFERTRLEKLIARANWSLGDLEDPYLKLQARDVYYLPCRFELDQIKKRIAELKVIDNLVCWDIHNDIVKNHEPLAVDLIVGGDAGQWDYIVYQFKHHQLVFFLEME